MKKLIAFILTLAAVLSTAQLDRDAEALSEKVLRLHVLAASDSDEDQRLKLLARDAVLAYLTPLLADCPDRAGAEATAAANLDGIASAAANASGQQASVTLLREDFPTREYGDVALPAGRYLSLKIELDGGRGRNWWCVVFPPLCAASASGAEEDALALFDSGELRLMSGSGRVIKLRLVEWLRRLRL